MRKSFIALLTVAVAGAASLSLALGGVRASAVTSLPIGNQQERLFDGRGCYIDFTMTETPQQAPGSAQLPEVTALTFGLSMHCPSSDSGWLNGTVSMSGGASLQSCQNSAPFNFSSLSLTVSCTIHNPPPGVYLANGSVSDPTVTVADSLQEIVLPGTGVPGLPVGIGNVSTTNDSAPCHMTSSITVTGSSVTATAHMTCDYAVYEPDYASVTLVGPLGSVCSNSTPQTYNFNTSFTTSCAMAAQPGEYVAVFHYSNWSTGSAVAGDTYTALATVVL